VTEEKLFLDVVLTVRGGLDGGGGGVLTELIGGLSKIGLSSSLLELRDEDTDDANEGAPYTAKDFLLKAGEYLGISPTGGWVFHDREERLLELFDVLMSGLV